MITQKVSNVRCGCSDSPVCSCTVCIESPDHTCNRCARPRLQREWSLSAEFLRKFFHDAEEGCLDLTHDEVAHFASRAVSRALSADALSEYQLNGFHKRDLQGEPEAELEDTGNYAAFQALKDIRAVEEDGLDPLKAAEDYRHLLDLTVQTIRLHKEWERFWANH